MELEVDNIRFGYNKERMILNGISLAAQKGELISVVGPNGCGKTTFVKCINGILQIASGNIIIDDKDISKIKREEIAKYIGYVPQMTSDTIGGTVMDIVIMGRKPYIGWKLTDEDIDIALNILESLDIEHLANEYIHDLSGGQRQKVLIARALAQDPLIYLFDEPISFLDIKNQVEIMKMAHNMVKEENKIVVMVVHDLNMAMRYSDKVLLMKNGNLVAFGGPKEVLTKENIKTVYGIEVKIMEESYIIPY